MNKSLSEHKSDQMLQAVKQSLTWMPVASQAGVFRGGMKNELP